MSQLVLHTEEDKIAILTLNKPNSFNALDMEITEEFLEKLDSCIASSTIRAIIITGAGKAFCAGGDLLKVCEAAVPPSEILGQMVRYLNLAIMDIKRSDKPIIAAINGVAAGAGLSLALACDLRVASSKAKFRQAYTSAGLTPDGGWTVFAPAQLGLGRAMELVLLDQAIDAETALSWGAINKICPEDQVMNTALEWAKHITSGPAYAFAQAKKLLNRTALPNLESFLEDERYSMIAASASEDGLEGINAFVEKRRPVFCKNNNGHQHPNRQTPFES